MRAPRPRMGNAPERAARRGFGIVLALSLLFLLILGLSVTSLGGMGSRVRREVRRGQDSTRARAMAEAAVEELTFLLETGAAEPGNPLFTALRDTAVRIPAAGFPLPVGGAAAGPPAFAAAVAPAYPDLALLSYSARLMDIRGFRCTQLPWHADHYGTVALEARVGARAGETGPTIAAERWLEFKVVCPGPPPPFDLATLTMVDPWNWAHAGARWSNDSPEENANRLVADILFDVRDAEQQIARLEARLNQLEALAPAVVAEARAGVQEARAVLAANRELIEWWQGPTPIADHKFFRTPHLRYVLGKDVDGDDVNIPPLMAAANPVRLAQYRATETLRTRLDRVTSAGQALEVLRPLRASSVGLLRTDMRILTDLRRIQESFVRRVGPTEIERVFRPHLDVLWNGTDDRASLIAGQPTYSAGRATHRVRGPGAGAQLAALLAAHGRPFTGIVEVENPGEPLVMAGAALAGFEGRLMLVVRGDAAITGLKVGRAGNQLTGLVTIVCHGLLSASGEVESSLIALGRFRTTGPLMVKGNLFLDGYRGQVFRDGTPPGDVLRGVKVVEDPRVRALDPARLSGPARPASYRVVFGPRPIHDVTHRVAEGGS